MSKPDRVESYLRALAKEKIYGVDGFILYALAKTGKDLSTGDIIKLAEKGEGKTKTDLSLATSTNYHSVARRLEYLISNRGLVQKEGTKTVRGQQYETYTLTPSGAQIIRKCETHH